VTKADEQFRQEAASLISHGRGHCDRSSYTSPAGDAYGMRQRSVSCLNLRINLAKSVSMHYKASLKIAFIAKWRFS
jgi:hypothetical protein